MRWTDDGIIIGTRRHGESSLIVELLTAEHGRHLGLVRGGRSRRQRAVLQLGNSVIAGWRARLDEHLGNFSIEPATMRAARFIEEPAALYGIQLLASLLRLLPERDPHPQIYLALAAMVDWLGDPVVGGAMVARFELRMLEELGVGLDLERCAATGSPSELVYVSPKSGRAVSRSAGEPYRHRMLPLPTFLRGSPSATPDPVEVTAAFALTGHFLNRHVWGPRGLAMPDTRLRYLELVANGANPRRSVAPGIAGL